MIKIHSLMSSWKLIFMKAYAVIITHVLNYCSQCILRLMYYVIYDLHTQDSDKFFLPDKRFLWDKLHLLQDGVLQSTLYIANLS